MRWMKTTQTVSFQENSHSARHEFPVGTGVTDQQLAAMGFDLDEVAVDLTPEEIRAGSEIHPTKRVLEWAAKDSARRDAEWAIRNA